MRFRSLPVIVGVPLVLGACANAIPGAYTDPNAGFATVLGQTSAAIGKRTAFAQTQAQNEALAREVRDMVQGKMISADTAVQAALLNNKGLQAAYANVGLSAAEAWQQSTPVNPIVSIGVLGIGAPELGAYRAIEGLFRANLLDATTRKQRVALADVNFRTAQQTSVNDTLTLANLTMTNHPIHMHGYDFKVTCTDGGWVPESAQWPEVSIDIPVGAMRAYEFTADHLGDWAIHCHKSHHTMNAMGHDVPTFIGVDKKPLTRKIRQFQPEYMPMGTAGMADTGKMEMPLPDNTVPMMTGWGPYGPIEMGGMFSVVKVRDGIGADDYSDPGWYENPPDEQAYEWTGELQEFASNDSPKTVITPKPTSKG